MKIDRISTAPGTPESADIYQPHMPGVDVLADMDGYFSKIREVLEMNDFEQVVKTSGLDSMVSPGHVNGQRYVAIVTPGRMVLFPPAPLPNSKSDKELAPIRQILRSETPLQITAISYTKLQPYMEDKTKTKVIPFLGSLLAFAYLGHNVVVFEGHPSAFEAGIRNSDFLLIDSGMLPFLQNDWGEMAFRIMRPNSRIFIHERKNFSLMPVAKKSSPPGWRYTEPDGEGSYANILLTTLANYGDPTKIIRVTFGFPLPNPAQLARQQDDMEYFSTLPFKYDRLNADLIIKIIWDRGQANPDVKLQSTKTFRAIVAESGGKSRPVSFELTLSKTTDAKPQLDIRLSGIGSTR